MRVNVSKPALTGCERKYVNQCLDEVRLSGGVFVERFERAFAEFCGVKYALSCSSGTAALHLAMLAMNVKAGDVVLIPALTYIATANVVRYCGAEVAICDVDEHTWCLNPTSVQLKCSELRRMGKRPVGVIPVHLYGVPCDMHWLSMVTQMERLWIVEDAAQAHGSNIDDRTVGSFGAMGTFSFFGNKVLTCGEGGMVTTNYERLAQHVRLFRGQGWNPQSPRYVHSLIGYNYRLTDVQAAIGLGQLEQWAKFAAIRAIVTHQYRDELSQFEQQEQRGYAVDWMFTVLVPKGIDRDAVMSNMEAMGVETRPVFPSISRQPVYAQPFQPCPIAEDIAERGINLPTHCGLDEDITSYVCDVFKSAVEAQS